MMKRAILFPFMLSIISLALAYFQVWPIYQDVETLQHDVVVTRELRDSRENYFNQLKDSKRKLDAHRAALADVQ